MMIMDKKIDEETVSIGTANGIACKKTVPPRGYACRPVITSSGIVKESNERKTFHVDLFRIIGVDVRIGKDVDDYEIVISGDNARCTHWTTGKFVGSDHYSRILQCRRLP
jgi:hypothetical protein